MGIYEKWGIVVSLCLIALIITLPLRFCTTTVNFEHGDVHAETTLRYRTSLSQEFLMRYGYWNLLDALEYNLNKRHMELEDINITHINGTCVTSVIR